MGSGMGSGMSTADDRAALNLGPLTYPPSAPQPRSASAPLTGEQRQQQKEQAAAQEVQALERAASARGRLEAQAVAGGAHEAFLLKVRAHQASAASAAQAQAVRSSAARAALNGDVRCSSTFTDEYLRATLRSYLLSVDLLTATSKEAKKHLERKLALTIPKGEQKERLNRLCVSVTKVSPNLNP